MYNDKLIRIYKQRLFFLFILFYMVYSLPLRAQSLNFPFDDGKHEEADFEAWTVFSHISNKAGDKFGVTIFFFSGKVIGINTSGVYVVIADEKNKIFQNISKIQLPLFSSTTHTVGKLLEDYSDNVIKRNQDDDSYSLNVEIDDFRISLKYTPLKQPIDIGNLAVGDGNFNRAYAIPRGDIIAKMNYRDEDYSLSGIGIFQHQWGSKPEQSALSDIFAIHMSDSTDILIYHSGTFPDINTFIQSDNTGKSKVDNNFVALTDTIYQDKSTGDKLKLKWRFEIPKNKLKLEILPNFDGQKIEMLGLNYWLSRCKVIEKIKASTQKGIGYVYIGYDEQN